MSIGYFQWTKIGCFRWTRSGSFRRTLTMGCSSKVSGARFLPKKGERGAAFPQQKQKTRRNRQVFVFVWKNQALALFARFAMRLILRAAVFL